MHSKKTYTLGEIVRLGLLKNAKGQPYKHVAGIVRVLKEVGKMKKVHTPHGFGYAVPLALIKKANARWINTNKN